MVETHRTGRTAHEIVEIPPSGCTNGHAFRGKRAALVGFLPCSCAGDNGHRTYRCATCGVVDYYLEHDLTLPPTLGSLYDP
jgi:hypothetical protein